MLAPMIDRADASLSVTGAIALVGCRSRNANRPPPADPQRLTRNRRRRALAAAATDERPRLDTPDWRSPAR
jgi:hypothetical protein